MDLIKICTKLKLVSSRIPTDLDNQIKHMEGILKEYEQSIEIDEQTNKLLFHAAPFGRTMDYLIDNDITNILLKGINAGDAFITNEDQVHENVYTEIMFHNFSFTVTKEIAEEIEKILSVKSEFKQHLIDNKNTLKVLQASLKKMKQERIKLIKHYRF